MLGLLVELAVEDRHADGHSAAPEALRQFPTHHGRLDRHRSDASREDQ